ncbi:AI-2E family transporter [Patescibacteria group bacterium]|nr:AI-2E family transporter [Patescibacteria group bacterium]
MPESTKVQHYFFLGLLTLVLALNALIFLPYLGPIVFALMLAVVCTPWHRKISAVMPRLPNISALITLILVAVIIFVPLTFVGVLVVHQAQSVYTTMANSTSGAQFLTSISDAIAQNFPSSQSHSVSAFLYNLNENTKLVLQYALGNASLVFSSAANIVLQILLVLLALFFFLRDGDRLKKVVIHISPLHNDDDEIILDHLERAVDSIVRGSVVMGLLQAIVASIGFLIFGVPNVALLGALTFFAAFIPGIGSALVVVPVALYLLLLVSPAAGIGMFLWAFLVGIVDNFVRPKIISRGTGIHPLLVLLSVFGGIGLLGPYGILIGPLLLSFLFALTDLYKRGIVE